MRRATPIPPDLLENASRAKQRDKFAISAIQGMLAHSRRYVPRDGAPDNWHDAIAQEAYEIADSMMKARV